MASDLKKAFASSKDTQHEAIEYEHTLRGQGREAGWSTQHESVEYQSLRHDLENGLEAGYIDAAYDSKTAYTPVFLSNDRSMGTNILSVIKRQLSECTSFDFSVAFVTRDGLQILVDTLNELRDAGITGRFLTSTYQNFTDGEALRKLTSFPNIEVRAYQGDMHTKGYFFNKRNLSTVIIGSANMTQRALTCNKEWNVLFHSLEDGEMLQSVRAEFDELWESGQTTLATPAWIDEYERYRKDRPKGHRVPKTFVAKEPEASAAPQQDIRPNAMQAQALEALSVLHERRCKRGLLISATGTGKTYLSAFDVRETKPERVLFIAHRERILEASMRSFKRVLGDRYTYGLYGSKHENQTATCTFAMIGTLARHLGEFPPDAFDYIIVDEAHHTGALQYRTVMDHFKPRFYLGMTATPSRSDGYDVFRQFNHVIAFRITLQDALENDMLVPFHYFGIADFEIDDVTVDDPAQFSRLTSEERVRHITRKIEDYSIGTEDRRGLIFCNRNDEARELSMLFNRRGYRTLALSGEDSDDKRREGIRKLEQGELQYLFSVDIFNEGIDIPSVNQIIMLRRTDSATIFVQQLGRGLRKDEGKTFTLVLDFIGNYQQNYLVPVALSGDRTYNKDNLRKFVKEGSTVIPGCSTISFDRVSEGRIFKAVDDGKFSSIKLIKDEYRHLKNVLGRIPHLADFDENESLDPLLIFQNCKSYPAFLLRYEDEYHEKFSAPELDFLDFVSRKLANGKRRGELDVIERLVYARESGRKGISCTEAAVGMGAADFESVVRVLSGEFSRNAKHGMLTCEGDHLLPSGAFAQALENASFRNHLLELVRFGQRRHATLYAQPYRDTSFNLYAKYTYEEVCRLLNWERNVNGQNVGGYKYDEPTNTFPVFINYDKDPGISDTIKYEDRFVSPQELIAISKQPRTLKSPEIVRLKNARKNGMRTYLFVRKNKKGSDGGKEFYFLGAMHPTGAFAEMTMPGTTKSAVEITYRLEIAVKSDLYDFFLSDFHDEEDGESESGA